jgi:hypothetical protein
VIRLHSIRPIWNLACLFYFKWARAELTRTNPMHPDLPMVVRRINDLERVA